MKVTNPQFNTEDVYNYVVLLAQNDGVAYADGKDAEAAVDRAIRDMHREVSEELRGDTRAIRSPAVAAVSRQWSGEDDPSEQILLHNPTGEPVVVLHLRAKNDINGNPQRLWMVVSDEGRVLSVIDEGYSDLPEQYRDVPRITIDLRQGQYRDMLRWGRSREGYTRNPLELELNEAMRASIGAALGGFVGAYGGLFTAAIAAAVGSLIGSNWKKVTAGMSAATKAYKATPARASGSRRNNPGPSKGRRDFIDFLENTLIPDMYESDPDSYVARDFEALVAFLRGAQDAEGFRRRDFMDFLEDTLIPDLRSSGVTSTANDFARGLRYLKRDVQTQARQETRAGPTTTRANNPGPSMGREENPNRSDVIRAWEQGRKLKASGLRTEDGKLWSYALLIGETIDGKLVAYDYTGSNRVSPTTTTHVNAAKTAADEVRSAEGRPGRYGNPRTDNPGPYGNPATWSVRKGGWYHEIWMAKDGTWGDFKQRGKYKTPEAAEAAVTKHHPGHEDYGLFPNSSRRNNPGLTTGAQLARRLKF
jgi:hypothetical protein